MEGYRKVSEVCSFLGISEEQFNKQFRGVTLSLFEDEWWIPVRDLQDLVLLGYFTD